MSDLHTLILIPPNGDATLLADEAGGGRVPQAEGFACNDIAHGLWWTVGDREPVGAPVCNACSARKRWREATGLLLVSGGAPVAMGCDRLLRVDHSFRDWISPTYTNEAALRFARAYADRHPGSKVVALSADGREVTP